MVTKEQIASEVNSRIIELHKMFDLAWGINEDYNKYRNWSDTDSLELSKMVTTYIPNVEQTLQALYNMLKSRSGNDDDFAIKFRY